MAITTRKKAVRRGSKPARAKAATQTKVKAGGISDEAVAAGTGKTWGEWLAILDRGGGRKLTHRQLVALVVKHGVGPWWQQMVTVGYEQARGLRVKHQTTSGFSISRSKTIAAPVGRLFEAWSDEGLRAAWLDADGMAVRNATRNRSMRITWTDATTNVEVMFYPKGSAKAQVTVQHNKLASAAAGEKMKKYWGEALERLADAVKV